MSLFPSGGCLSCKHGHDLGPARRGVCCLGHLASPSVPAGSGGGEITSSLHSTAAWADQAIAEARSRRRAASPEPTARIRRPAAGPAAAESEEMQASCSATESVWTTASPRSSPGSGRSSGGPSLACAVLLRRDCGPEGSFRRPAWSYRVLIYRRADGPGLKLGPDSLRRAVP